MQIVPIDAVPNQTLQAQLGGQATVLSIYQTAYGLFMDVAVNNDPPLAAGVICENLNRVVRYSYLGFVGDFVFVDTQGSDDPIYTGLGARFLLVYLPPADIPAGED